MSFAASLNKQISSHSMPPLRRPARANMAGGFAVVADEVRTLASKTQQSTAEIKNMIDILQSGAKEAVGVMTAGSGLTQESVIQAEKTGLTLNAITHAVSEISVTNTQIATAAEQQAAATEEINGHMTNINGLLKQSISSAEEIEISAEELNKVATQLRSQVNQFTL